MTSGLTGGRFYLVLIAVALAIGGISLLIPSTPSYDPWSWLIWGREIIHLDLQTTGGPTWKPLPMIPITLLSPLGGAAPDLWLVIARAGAVMAVVMVFKVALTTTRLIAGGHADAAGVGLVRERFATLAPGLLAGAIAGITLALSGGFISDNALGYSEGLMTACVLIAVERHLDGRPRQAFAVSFLAALDRPEVWLLWGPYGLWLFWRDPGARRLVISFFVLIPVLWFLPEYWGSGHFFRGVSRAHTPRSNSAAFAAFPFLSELVDHAWLWVLLRIKVAAALGAGAAAVQLWRVHRERGGWRLEGTREHALGALLGAGLLGLLWFVVIAIMTQAGFSGNDRYLVLGAALIDIAGGAAFGWAAYALARRAVRLGRARLDATAAALAAVAVMLLVYVFVPNWVGKNLIAIPRTHKALVYQANLRIDAADAIQKLGGRDHVLACGTIMTEGFNVPLLAWSLNVPMLRIEAAPPTGGPYGTPPDAIFQTRATHHASLLPRLTDWASTSYQLVHRNKTFKVYAHCAGGAGL